MRLTVSSSSSSPSSVSGRLSSSPPHAIVGISPVQKYELRATRCPRCRDIFFDKKQKLKMGCQTEPEVDDGQGLFLVANATGLASSRLTRLPNARTCDEIHKHERCLFKQPAVDWLKFPGQHRHPMPRGKSRSRHRTAECSGPAVGDGVIWPSLLSPDLATVP